MGNEAAFGLKVQQRGLPDSRCSAASWLMASVIEIITIDSSIHSVKSLQSEKAMVWTFIVPDI